MREGGRGRGGWVGRGEWWRVFGPAAAGVTRSWPAHRLGRTYAAHDNRDVFQVLPDGLPVIDIRSL